MLTIGIIFILIGIYLTGENFYDLKAFLKTKKLARINGTGDYEYSKLKIAHGIFCIVVGVFSLLNYFSR